MSNLLDWIGLLCFPLIWAAWIAGAGWSGLMFGWMPALIIGGYVYLCSRMFEALSN